LNDPTEADLVCRSQGGDSHAFRLLLERYRPMLLGTAVLMARDHGLAEDVVQEAVLKAWRGLPAFRNDGGLRPWLMRILVNQARQELRKKRVRTTLLDEAFSVPGDSGLPEDGVVKTEERALLRQALQELSAEQRETVVLRYFSDLTVPEIARALGCREGTVKSRLHRALERLSTLLPQDLRPAPRGAREDGE
jgi:RNA polymerase sigma-70 factor (ECF subfamily)